MNDRIIIPASQRDLILNKLHTGHSGIPKSIMKAQNTVYWPNINIDIENFVNKCDLCNKYANSITEKRQ